MYSEQPGQSSSFGNHPTTVNSSGAPGTCSETPANPGTRTFSVRHTFVMFRCHQRPSQTPSRGQQSRSELWACVAQSRVRYGVTRTPYGPGHGGLPPGGRARRRTWGGNGQRYQDETCLLCPQSDDVTSPCRGPLQDTVRHSVTNLKLCEAGRCVQVGDGWCLE